MDLTALSDDQLLTLFRAACAEIGSRSDGVKVAAAAVEIDEAEKVRIATEAAEREAGAQRARERERIAKEAAERVRAEAAAKAPKRDDAAVALRNEEARKDLLRGFARLLGKRPQDISLLVWQKWSNSKCLIVCHGDDTYDSPRLVTYSGVDGELKLSGVDRSARNALIAECAKVIALGNRKLIGAEFDWSDEAVSA